MNILLLESNTFAHWFEQLGHNVLSLLWKKRPSGNPRTLHIQSPLYYKDLQLIFQEHDFEPDLVVWHDMGNIPRVWGLEALNCPTVGYFIDTFCNPWHIPYSAAFDCVFTAQKNTLQYFNQDRLPRDVFWKPLFCDPKVDFHDNRPRDIPVCFVGTLHPLQNPVRYDFFKRFQRLQPIILKQGVYQPLFARSRIVLNQSVAGEINYRVFQAAACGAAVLNENVDNGFTELFTPGVEMLPLYKRNDAHDAARVAREALEDHETTANIARAAQELVLTRHSAPVRCKQILDWYAGAQEAVTRRLDNGPRLREMLSLACRFIIGEQYSILDPAILEHFKRLEAQYVKRWNKLCSLERHKA